MAAAKPRRILVSTVRGPEYRYVNPKNLSSYGRVGQQAGQPVLARKRAVEVRQGEIQKRAVSAQTLKEKYRPGPGGIFYRPTAAPPTADVEQVQRQEMAAVQERYAPPPKPVPIKAEAAQPAARQLPPEDIFRDPDREALRRSVPTGTAAPKPTQPSVIPESTETQHESRLPPATREDIIKDEVLIIDKQGGSVQTTDEEGNPTYSKTMLITDTKQYGLLKPVIDDKTGRQREEYSGGRMKKVYRRTAGVREERITREEATQLPGEKVQWIIEMDITINGETRRIMGWSGTERTRPGGNRLMEAKDSFLRHAGYEFGIPSDRQDLVEQLETALAERPNEVFAPRRLIY